ncbi:hypothetical protein [Nocardia alba]|uniref:Uncharacterized protein n=1 Tax=Nocardia alba TaxID=225051 RepID=A0A4R1F2X4_9NOCA|nr:hypothetical protein [Nocardia alba]TCJ88133.1 hypothetical protein DFR71_6675 [Nocardia alba]
MFPFDTPIPESVKDTINKVIADRRGELFAGVIEALQPEIDRAIAQTTIGLQARDVDPEILRGYRSR